MVRNKPQLRMTVSTGNESEFRLFQGIIKDAAALDGVTPSSAVIARCICPSLPPAECEQADLWAQRIFCGTWSMRDTLAQVSAENAAGARFHAVHNNYDGLVKFAHSVALDWGLRTNTELPEMHHFMSCFESVVGKAAKDASSDEFFDPNYGARLLESYGSENNGQPISNALLFILDNWESLGDYTYTFRMLGDLFRISTGWRDCKVVKGAIELLHTPDAAARRKELIAVLAEIEKGWR